MGHSDGLTARLSVIWSYTLSRLLGAPGLVCLTYLIISLAILGWMLVDHLRQVFRDRPR